MSEFDNAVIRECARQTELKKAGKFQYECGEAGDVHALSVVVEEVGEVARAINDSDLENLKEELVQVAACCRKWYWYLHTKEGL